MGVKNHCGNWTSKTSLWELFSIMKLLIRRDIIITHFCAKHTALASGGIVPHQHSKVSKYKTSQVFSAWPKVSTTKSQNRERHHSRVNGRVISVPNWTKKGNFSPHAHFPNKNWMNTSFGVLVFFILKCINLISISFYFR